MGEIQVERPTTDIVRCTIASPPVNALSGAMLAALREALMRVDKDLSVRALILRGEGAHFCAGADLGGEKSGLVDGFSPMLDLLDRLRVPVVAAIHGACAGGGLELALCCDIRIASPAAKFICAGVNMGLTASGARLPGMVGLSAASFPLLTGLPFDGAEAYRIGLVAKLVDEQALDEEALAIAQRIATRAPLSVEATRRIARASTHEDGEALSTLQREAMTRLRRSNDHAAAVAAHRSRSLPVFTRS